MKVEKDKNGKGEEEREKREIGEEERWGEEEVKGR